MTEDRIKAIAEKYVKHATTQKCVWRFHPETDLKVAIQAEALQLLKYLSTYYCIVEREKVRELYKEARNRFNHKQMFTSAEGMIELNLLEQIFGASVFNQNEAKK